MVVSAVDHLLLQAKLILAPNHNLLGSTSRISCACTRASGTGHSRPFFCCCPACMMSPQALLWGCMRGVCTAPCCRWVDPGQTLQRGVGRVARRMNTVRPGYPCALATLWTQQRAARASPQVTHLRWHLTDCILIPAVLAVNSDQATVSPSAHASQLHAISCVLCCMHAVSQHDVDPMARTILANTALD